MSSNITPPQARVRVRTKPPQAQAEANPPRAEAQPAGYKVGYCRPPVATRFKRGKSGNERGRPKGSQNTDTLVETELKKPIKAKSGGRTIKMTRREALVQRLIEKGLGGDIRAIVLLLRRELDAAATAPSQVEPTAAEPLSAADESILEALLAAANKGGVA